MTISSFVAQQGAKLTCCCSSYSRSVLKKAHRHSKQGGPRRCLSTEVVWAQWVPLSTAGGAPGRRLASTATDHNNNNNYDALSTTNFFTHKEIICVSRVFHADWLAWRNKTIFPTRASSVKTCRKLPLHRVSLHLPISFECKLVARQELVAFGVNAASDHIHYTPNTKKRNCGEWREENLSLLCGPVTR